MFYISRLITWLKFPWEQKIHKQLNLHQIQHRFILVFYGVRVTNEKKRINEMS